MRPEEIIREFEKKGYRFYGTGGVEICHWTRKSILGEGTCYKETFYGVPAHRCMEFSPAALFCNNNCIYCWRPAEFLQPPKDVEWTEPEEMVEHLIELRKQLLIGFRGNPKVDREKLEEAFIPVHFAISLSGEPTLYPHLPHLIRYLQQREGTFSVFLVTNGQVPDMLEKVVKNAPPTQLYLSLTAPTPELYRKISVPTAEDAWERLVRSVEIVSRARTRTVLRITVIRGWNDTLAEKWAALIKRANAHFVEFKAYMHVGYSQHRLPRDAMPEHEYVKEFAQKVMRGLKYRYMDEHIPSRVVVYRNEGRKCERWIKGPKPSDNSFEVEE